MLQELKFYLGENPLVLPSVVVLLAVVAVGIYFIPKSSGVQYREVSGTVCCMSKNTVVLRVKKPKVTKMMYVDLDSGKRVEVPIMDIPYISGKKILLMQRSEPDHLGITYSAIRYF